MDGCCIVCAEPLEWTAYGSCGHMETCSKCVVRLRLIMDDKRCVICQQESESVYVTRYMGDYTTKLSGHQFQQLPEQARNLEIFHQPAVNGFFDDEEHFKSIKNVSGITHPILDDIPDVPTFTNVVSLRAFIQTKCGKHLCHICLEGRKVFLREHILYTKNGLKRHMEKGDADGAHGIAGFKGHPLCRFCSRRFYSDHELYLHNQQNHETCFVCRSSNPDQYTYYRNYEELDDHFRNKHFPCPHPMCQERKFIVFSTEAELNQHFNREHKESVGGLCRAQLREQMALETNFLTRRGRRDEEDQHQHQHQQLFDARAGVVIGGGGNVQSRVARRTHQPQNINREFQGIPDQVFQESIESRSFEPPQLTGADFPTLQPGPSAAASANGNWAGRGGSHQGPGMRPEDFPSLPLQVKKSKSKKSRGKSSATWNQAQNTSSNAVRGDVEAGSAAGPSTQKVKKNTETTQFRVPSRQVTTMPPSWVQTPARAPGMDTKGNSHAPDSKKVQPKRQSLPPEHTRRPPPDPVRRDPAPRPEDFPSLGSSSHQAAQPQWQVTRVAKDPMKSKGGKAPAAAPVKKKPDVSKMEEFPSLSLKPSKSQSSKMQGGPSHSQREVPDITQELRATTRSLANQIKAQLPRPEYKQFKEVAASFCESTISVDAYHDMIVQLGIAQYVGGLAAVCPVPALGSELVEIHRRYVALVQKDPDCAPPNVPVDVLVASLANLEKEGLSWYCSSCKVTNAPQADFCEVCDKERPSKEQAARPSSSSAKGSVKGQVAKRQSASGSVGTLRKKDNKQLFGTRTALKGGNSPWKGAHK